MHKHHQRTQPGLLMLFVVCLLAFVSIFGIVKYQQSIAGFVMAAVQRVRAALSSVTLNNGSTSIALGNDVTAQTSSLSPDIAAYRWSYNGTDFAVLSLPFQSGTSQTDISGGSHTGTLQNGAAYTASGRVGGGISFDGVDDYISFAGVPTYSPGTFSVWVNPSANTNRVIQDDNGTFAASRLYLNGSGKAVYSYFDNTGSTCKTVTSTTTIPTGSWSHIVTRLTASTIAIFVNGTLEASTSISSPANNFSADYKLGKGEIQQDCFGSVPSQFQGTMDEAQIYNRSLSSAEITQLYTDGSSGVGGPSVIKTNETLTGQIWNLSVTPVSSAGSLGSSVPSSNTVTITAAVLTSVTLNNGTSTVVTGNDVSSQANSLATDTGAYRWTYDSDGFGAGAAQNLMKVNMPFNAGSTQYDMSGLGVHGTVNGAATVYTASGKVGGAGSFDGVDDYVALPNGSVNFANATQGTVSAWVKTTCSNTFCPIFETDGDTTGNYRVTLRLASGVAAFDLYNGSYLSATGSTNIADNAWHFVVGTWDASTVRVYVDGVLNGSTPSGSFTLDNYSLTGTRTTIGAIYYPPVPPDYHDFYSGLIDELQVYSRSLTTAEITQLYTDGSAGAGGPTTIKSGATAVGQLWDLTITPITSAGALGTAVTSSNMVLITAAASGITGILNSPNESQSLIATMTVPAGSVGGYQWRDNGTSIMLLDLPMNSGSTVSDASGNANHGTATNGPTYSTGSGCKVGGCLTFDGSNDYINVPHTSALNLTGSSATFEFWFKPNALPGYRDVLQKGIGSGLAQYYVRTSTTGLEFYFGNGTRGYAISPTYTQASTSVGTWTHFVFSINDTAQTAALYVNGSLALTTTATSSVLSANSLPLTIGGFTWDGYSSAVMDEVRIYNRALSASQALQNYNEGRGSSQSATDGIGGPTLITASDHSYGEVWDLLTTEYFNAGSVGNISYIGRATISAGPVTTINVTTPVGTQSNTIVVSYTCSASDNTTRDLLVEYSTNGGGAYASASVMGPSSGSMSGSTIVGATCDGSSQSFRWSSVANGVANNTTNANVRIRLTAQMNAAPSGETSNFTVANALINTISTTTTISSVNSTYDNTSIVCTGTTLTVDGTHPFANVILQNGCTLTQTATTTSSVNKTILTIAALFSVDSTSTVDLTGTGFRAGYTTNGSGGTVQYGTFAGIAGGSHGGIGGGVSAVTTDSLTQPIEPGNGADYGGQSPATGGLGGGYMRLTTVDFSMNGNMIASGTQGTVHTTGGAGGGYWITTTGAISGTGTIGVNGRNSCCAGSGGGGRIAFYYNSAIGGNSSPAFTFQAFGGSTATPAAAGTIYLEDSNVHSAGQGIVTVANNTTTSPDNGTPVPNGTYASLTVKDGAFAINNGTLTIPTILINSSGRLVAATVAATNLTLSNSSTLYHDFTTTSTVYSLQVTATNVSIDSTSSISASGRGYVGGGNGGSGSLCGYTSGNTLFSCGATANKDGGSYGGLGGDGVGATGIAPAYGSLVNPTEPGGGGGAYEFINSTAGGRGGGLIRLTVSGTVTNNGTIAANAGASVNMGGGGAGGGIYINTPTLTGSGTITANGGAPGGNCFAGDGGGGGGGRVAIYYTTNTLAGSITANGGAGSCTSTPHGGAGTVYLKSSSQTNGDLTVKNNNLTPAEASTPLPATPTVFDSITISNAARVSSTTLSQVVGALSLNNAWFTQGATSQIQVGSLDLASSSLYTHTATTTTAVYKVNLAVSGSATIDATSSIQVNGRGYIGGGTGSASLCGYTSGNTLFACGGSPNKDGGSYGGLSGDGVGGSAIAPAYGSLTDPSEPGGGGGALEFINTTVGGYGGGLIRLAVTGTLTNNGTIAANAGASSNQGGGGAGGGIRIDAATWAGTGSITANGGAPGGNCFGGDGAGGGGGRIAVYYATNASTNTVTAYPGAGSCTTTPHGAGGTVFMKDTAAANGSLTVSNNSLNAAAGTHTPLFVTGGPSTYTFVNLSVINQAELYIDTPCSGTPALTVTGYTSLAGSGTITNNQPVSCTASLGLITITTTSLPAATIGSAYSQTIASAGGYGPHTFQCVSGGSPVACSTVLPPGLSMSSAGVITGTPTTVGSYPFTVRATEASPGVGTDDQALTIVVSTTPTAPTNLFSNSTNAQSGSTNPTGIDGTPVFSAVFNDPDVGDTSSSYQIQVASDSGFTSLMWDSGSGGTAMTSCANGARCADISYGGLALNLSNITYYWRIKYFDSANFASPFSATATFTTLSAPTAPTNLFSDSTNAQSGSTNPSGLDTTPVFSAVFNDPDAGDTSAKYRLEVSAVSDFSSLLWDSGSSGTAMAVCADGARCQDISYAGSALSLGGNLYYWRIKFWDSTDTEGAFSATATFTTSATPTAPTDMYSNSSDAQSCCTTPSGIDLTPVFSAVFHDPDVAETAAMYRLQVAADTGFTTLLWDSGGAGTALGSSCANGARCENIFYGGSSLSLGTTYYWRIKFWDNIGTEGVFSANTDFTTSFSPTAPTDLYSDSTNAQSGSTNPTGLDTTPVFSAVFQDPDTGHTATKYRIQVASDVGFTTLLWDTNAAGTALGSSCAIGARCEDIAYGGSALSLGAQTYYWHIKFWDSADTEGAYSATAFFTTLAVPDAPTNLFSDSTNAQSGSTAATGLDDTPVFSAIFTHATGSETGEKYRLQVASDTGFTSLLWDSGSGGTAFATSCVNGSRCEDISYAGSALSLGGVTYYWRVQYFDSLDNAGPFSTTATFTTSAAPTAPTDLYTDSTNAQSGSTDPGGIDIDPVFSAVFQDPDTGAVANMYRVQVATDTGFTTLLWDSGAAGTSMSNCNNAARCADIAFGGSGITIGANTYYWRIKFWDSIGVEGAYSATALFSTQAVPTTPTALYVGDTSAQTGNSNPTGITAGAPKMSAIFNHQNIGALADKYRVQVDNNNDFSSVLWDSGAAGTNMNICNAAARCDDITYGGSSLSQNGEIYYWRIKYWDTTSLEGPWSEDPISTNTFTMASGGSSVQYQQQQQQQNQQGPAPIIQQPNTIPTAPAAISVTVVSDTVLHYVWSDQSNDETGFRLYDDQGNIIATVGAGITTADETNVQPNTTYSGRHIVAFNDAGESAASTFDSATTFMPMLTPSVVSRTANSVTFTVLPVVSNLDQGQSGVQYELVIIPADPAQAGYTVRSEWQQTLGYTITGVNPLDDVQVRVVSRNQNGEPVAPSAFVDIGKYGRIFNAVLNILDKATGQLSNPIDPNAMLSVDMSVQSVGVDSASSVTLNLPLPNYILYRQGTLSVDGNVSADLAQQGAVANQNGVSASWATVSPGESHRVHFELAFDTDALRALITNNETLNQTAAAANPSISLQASVSFAESDIVYMSPAVVLEPNLIALQPTQIEPTPTPSPEPIPPQPITEQTPVTLPTPSETQTIQEILQQVFEPAPSTPQTQPGETTTSSDNGSFNVDVTSGGQRLGLSGSATVVADQIQFTGTTTEPFTIVTLIFNDGVTAIVVSDANGFWQTLVDAERLGISVGQEARVKIEAIAAKGDVRSDRVSVGEVMISRGRSGDLSADFATTVSDFPALTIMKEVQKQAIRVIEKNQPAIQTTLTVSAPIVVASSVPLWGYLPYAPTIIYHLITYVIGYSGRKKRLAARFYGVAYDSITKQPLALAIIRIYKVEATLPQAASMGAAAATVRKLVTTVVTDKQGRYDALLKPGSYTLEVAKPGYLFPSQIVTTELDADYQHVYTDAKGIVVEGEKITIPDVPLDPVNAQRQWQLATGFKKVWMVFQRVGNYLATPLLIVGAVSSVAVVAAVPDKTINWVIAMFYIVLLTMQLQLRTKLQKAWGVVYDVATDAVLPLTAVQLIEPASSKVVMSRLSDYEGRFTFLPEPGQYVLKANKPGYEQVAEVLEAPQTDRQPLHGEVKIDKLGHGISGDIPMRQQS